MKDVENKKKEYLILGNSKALNWNCFVGWCVVTDIDNTVDTPKDNKEK